MDSGDPRSIEESYYRLAPEQQAMWKRAAEVAQGDNFPPLARELALDVTCLLVVLGGLREHLEAGVETTKCGRPR